MGQTYNIGGNNESSNLALVKSLCRVLAQEISCSEQELVDLITFVKDRPGHDQRYAIDASKLRDECGWTPTRTLEQGLAETVRWYVQHQDWVSNITSGQYRKWIEENYGARAQS